MADLQSYNETEVDWKAIQSLAVRAAKETPLKPAPAIGYVNENQQFIDVCGPHWLLDARTERVENARNGLGEDETYTWLFVLMPDGQLKRVLIRSLYTYRTEGTWSKREHTHSVDPMSDSEIESFDFAKGSYNLYNDYGRIWGNAFREGGASQQKLLHASRGAGLSLLLDNIRTGRAHQDDGGVVPFREETAETRTQHLPRLTEFHYTPDVRAKAVSDLQAADREAVAEREGVAHAGSGPIAMGSKSKLIVAGIALLVIAPLQWLLFPKHGRGVVSVHDAIVMAVIGGLGLILVAIGL